MVLNLNLIMMMMVMIMIMNHDMMMYDDNDDDDDAHPLEDVDDNHCKFLWWETESAPDPLYWKIGKGL